MSLVLLHRLREQQRGVILARRNRTAKRSELDRRLDAIGAHFRSRSPSPRIPAKRKPGDKESLASLCVSIEAATAFKCPTSPSAAAKPSPTSSTKLTGFGLLCRGKPASSPRHSHLYLGSKLFTPVKPGAESPSSGSNAQPAVACRFEANKYMRLRRERSEPIKLPEFGFALGAAITAVDGLIRLVSNFQISIPKACIFRTIPGCRADRSRFTRLWARTSRTSTPLLSSSTLPRSSSCWI